MFPEVELPEAIPQIPEHPPTEGIILSYENLNKKIFPHQSVKYVHCFMSIFTIFNAKILISLESLMYPRQGTVYGLPLKSQIPFIQQIMINY